MFLLSILVHWLFNLSHESRGDDQACQMCIMSSCIKTQPPLVALFISHQCILLLCSKYTFYYKHRRQMGTHACMRADMHTLTHQPADHRDLISCCHNTFIPHLCLGAVMSKRLLSAAKWQSGLLTVFSFSLMESDGMGLGHLYLCPNRRDFCPKIALLSACLSCWAR